MQRIRVCEIKKKLNTNFCNNNFCEMNIEHNGLTKYVIVLKTKKKKKHSKKRLN